MKTPPMIEKKKRGRAAKRRKVLNVCVCVHRWVNVLGKEDRRGRQWAWEENLLKRKSKWFSRRRGLTTIEEEEEEEGQTPQSTLCPHK